MSKQLIDNARAVIRSAHEEQGASAIVLAITKDEDGDEGVLIDAKVTAASLAQMLASMLVKEPNLVPAVRTALAAYEELQEQPITPTDN